MKVEHKVFYGWFKPAILLTSISVNKKCSSILWEVCSTTMLLTAQQNMKLTSNTSILSIYITNSGLHWNCKCNSSIGGKNHAILTVRWDNLQMKQLMLYIEVSKSFTVTRITIQKGTYDCDLKMIQLVCNLSKPVKQTTHHVSHMLYSRFRRSAGSRCDLLPYCAHGKNGTAMRPVTTQGFPPTPWCAQASPPPSFCIPPLELNSSRSQGLASA